MRQFWTVPADGPAATRRPFTYNMNRLSAVTVTGKALDTTVTSNTRRKCSTTAPARVPAPGWLIQPSSATAGMLKASNNPSHFIPTPPDLLFAGCAKLH